MAATLGARGRILLTAAGIVVGGIIVYLGVSMTAPTGPSESALEQIPVPDEIQYGAWSDTTWARAARRPSLVFLFIADEWSPWTDSVDAILNGSEDLRATISRRFVPIRMDRRVRPDLAERYAEGRVPFLSVLLPSGEALITLDSDESTWHQQLLEADRYWRDHKDELRDRAASFWQNVEADTLSGRELRRPDPGDLDMVRESVHLFVDSLLKLDGTQADLWRPDIQRFLAAEVRAGGVQTSARQILDRVYARRYSPDTPLVRLLTPAVLSQCLADLDRTQQQDDKHRPLTKAAMKRRPITTEELALVSRFTGGVELDVQLGTWVDTTRGYEHSCRHLLREECDLDGYLLDAVAVLEWFLINDQPPDPRRAAMLADSMWAALWDADRMALRDKPARPGPVRDVSIYPRTQLGRVAYLFDLLSVRTGEELWRRRADSCLTGMAPYVADAGPAAAYYGWALLMRMQASAGSGFPTTTRNSGETGT